MGYATVQVIKPGLLTTVQDLGRPSLAAQGVPRAGALDSVALRLANRMVGNDDAAAALEIQIQGPLLATDRNLVAAVVGGQFGPTPGMSFVWQAGESLDLRQGAGTPRAILALSGGLRVPMVLGSAATCVTARFGGHEGRALRPGDRIEVGFPQRAARSSLPPGLVLENPKRLTVRVLPGPGVDFVGADLLEQFCAATWSIGPASDRTGCRLDGLRLVMPAGSDLLPPLPTVEGTIQLTAAGQPIVLWAERPVTGGYPQIATVIAADLGALARATVGAQIRFAVTTIDQAQRALARQEEQLRSLAEEL